MNQRPLAYPVDQEPEQRGSDHGGQGKQAVQAAGLLQGMHSDHFQGCHAAVGCQNLVGEKIDGEGAKRKNRGIEREAKADHKPV